MRRAASGSAPAAAATQQRGSARARGYTHRWDLASKAFLAEHPACLGCEAVGRAEPSTVTDHVIPHRDDDALMWSEDNWQLSFQWHHDVVKQRLEQLFDGGIVDDDALRWGVTALSALALDFLEGA